MIPAWLLDVFAGVMLAVAAVSAARIAAARPWRGGQRAAEADIDAAHLLMAIAMTGTLAPRLRTLPAGAWEVVFGVLTAWFAYRVARDAQVSGFRALAGGHCAPHLLHAAAMLYMFLALTAPASHGGGMSGMGGAAASAIGTPGAASRRVSSSRCSWSATASGVHPHRPARPAGAAVRPARQGGAADLPLAAGLAELRCRCAHVLVATLSERLINVPMAPWSRGGARLVPVAGGLRCAGAGPVFP